MIQFDKKISVTAAFLAALTIGIGAFGAHGLERIVDAEAISTFETGVRYQMYHVLALLVIGLSGGIPKKTRNRVFVCFILGIILFSGSIYFLALKTVLPFEVSFLGPVTPLGGLLFILGWLILGFNLLTIKRG